MNYSTMKLRSQAKYKKAPLKKTAGKSAQKRKVSKSPPKTIQIFELEVVVCGVEPKLWRRIQVPKSSNFRDLAEAINASMGWYNNYGRSFRAQDPHNHDHIVYINKKRHFPISDPDPAEKVEENVQISDYLVEPKIHVEYEFDDAEAWLCHVVLLRVFDVAAGKLRDYPKCVDGARAAPPMECGGLDTYLDIVRAFAEPDNDDEELECLREWAKDMCPEGYHPEVFNIDECII